MNYKAYEIFLQGQDAETLYQFFQVKYLTPRDVLHDMTMEEIKYNQNNRNTKASYPEIVYEFFFVMVKLGHTSNLDGIILHLVKAYENTKKKVEFFSVENDPGVILYKDGKSLDLSLKKQISLMKTQTINNLIEFKKMNRRNQ